VADLTEAFLNGELEDEAICIAQPPGHEDGTARVWRLRKALYGLKQAARALHRKLRDGLGEIGYLPSTADPALFVRVDRVGERRYIFTHVDDLMSAARGLLGRDDLGRSLSSV